MFENFKKITIKGGCFENDTELELFKKDALSVVYGRNGSGKTTIAHCIAELTKPDEEKSADYTVTADAPIADDMQESVFIFDEDFVRNQVRVEGEGINTIVMLGEQVELDGQINAKKEELRLKTEEYTQQEELVNKYGDAGQNISPLYYWNQIRDGLRAEDGWAEIDRQVKGNRMMSRITEDVVNTLIAMGEPAETYEQLREQLMRDLHLYLESENAQAIEWSAGERVMPEKLDGVKELLQQPVDAPKLNDREQRLVTMLALHPQHSTQETKQMVDEGWTFCPTCLREIGEQDKKYIVETLEHILNKEADNYAGLLELQLREFAVVDTQMPSFSGNLNEREVNAAVTAREAFNRVLAAIRDKVEQRKRNIYQPLQEAIDKNLEQAYLNAKTAWDAALQAVKKCVEQFNETVNKRNKLAAQVRTENYKLARKQLAASLLGYKQAIANEQKDKAKLNVLKGEKEAIEMAIKELKSQKERTDIALDYINKELRYVFYSNRKVKLEPGEGCYKLKVNGRNVKPNKISVGERNVLGLCYFFAKLYSGKTEAGRYASESLIVIDDPVSSFDYGNRVGVMSLLRFQFGNILKGNDKSRILVMSHDLHSVFDLVKIRNEVVAGRKPDQVFMELLNNKLELKSMQNEYKKLLEYVYAYAANTGADNPDETLEMSIGNVMRRMMEAFSSFCYNETFERMVRNPEVLASIPDGKRGYYENFMGRLTLNTESHMAESVYTLDTITTCFTKDEKLQTAKSVLLFLLYVNRPHLVAYLDAAQLATIESWKTEQVGWLVE